MAMPTFLRISPDLRINLSNVTHVVAAPAVTARIGAAAQEAGVCVYLVGKKLPLTLRGADAEAFKNFVDGIGQQLAVSAKAEPDAADFNNAMSGRDFGSLVNG